MTQNRTGMHPKQAVVGSLHTPHSSILNHSTPLLLVPVSPSIPVKGKELHPVRVRYSTPPIRPSRTLKPSLRAQQGTICPAKGVLRDRLHRGRCKGKAKHHTTQAASRHLIQYGVPMSSGHLFLRLLENDMCEWVKGKGKWGR